MEPLHYNKSEKDVGRRNVKSSQRTKVKRLPTRQTRFRRPARQTSALPEEAQEFMQKFLQWSESFHHPARRIGYIQQVCERITERYQPEKIILFGSHAWGQPTPESDLDLLVVMHFEGSPIQQAIKVSSELGLVTPMDLLIRTPEQVQERLRIDDPFIRDIWQRGKVMYEAHHG